MKFYLCWWFGGIPIKEFYGDHIKPIIQENNIKQILHVPFARVGISHRIRDDQLPPKFEQISNNFDIEYFNAMFFEDIEKFQNGLIFINGGTYRDFLMEMIKFPQLFKKVTNADCIFWECSGATIFGEYRTNSEKNWYKKGLGLLKDTIIVTHYNQRKDNEKMKQLYQQGIDQYHCKMIGIDDATTIEYENGEIKNKIWTGSFYQL